jgi:hypothetical protein
MDDWLKREHLAQTERQIAQGERYIAGQREIVADLERTGGEAYAARRQLQLLEVAHRLLVADRHRLRRELGKPDGPHQ